MTQEEKQLLLKDLCARLPYGVMVSVQGGEFDSYRYPYQLTAVSKFGLDSFCKVYHPIYTPFGVPNVEDIKPYLRSKESMTEEETKTYRTLQDIACSYHYEFGDIVEDFLYFDNDVSLDYLNSIHIDYRGLIPMGLALEATKDIYKTE